MDAGVCTPGTAKCHQPEPTSPVGLFEMKSSPCDLIHSSLQQLFPGHPELGTEDTTVNRTFALGSLFLQEGTLSSYIDCQEIKQETREVLVL